MSEKEYIEALLESDQLEVINGDLFYNGERLTDPTPKETMVPNEFGMFGNFDEYYCRENFWINEEIEKYANSGDPERIEAARRMPRRIMFFDTREQLDNAPREIQNIFWANHYNTTHMGSYTKLLDANLSPIQDRYWPRIGAYNIPGFTTRRGLERIMRRKILFMLNDEYTRINAGDGKLGLG